MTFLYSGSNVCHSFSNVCPPPMCVHVYVHVACVHVCVHMCIHVACMCMHVYMQYIDVIMHFSGLFVMASFHPENTYMALQKDTP